MLSSEERRTGFKEVQIQIEKRKERDIPGNRENIHKLMLTRSFRTSSEFIRKRKEPKSNRIETRKDRRKIVRGRSRESKESFAQSFEFNFELKETQEKSENKRT